MKKFLALLFVCAGLTAMAAPHVNKAELTQANKGQMVMKANNLTNNLTAGVTKNFMEAAKKNVQMNHATNLVNKRAPRRLSNEEIINIPYVCFLYAYDVLGDEPVEADPYFAGGGAYWYPDTSQGLYFAGLYWDQDGSTYYLPLDIDYATGEVALKWGILLDDDTVSTQPGGRNRTDTITYSMLVSQAYWENQEQTNCKGTLYEDGSIIFDDNYVYYFEQLVQTYRNNQLRTSDTTVIATMFVGTEILAANGVMTYINEQNGKAEESPVYMFQEGDVLTVGNMWNYGVPTCKMTLVEGGKALYECAEFNPEDSITYLSNPIWDVNDTWIAGGLGMFYPVGSYELDEEGYITDYTWGFEADATPDEITWPYTMPSNGYHFLYGYQNNVLKYTNGNKFELPGGGFTRGDVDNDGNVAIADVTALIDALLSGNFDDGDEFSSDAADCDLDGEIAIADVTTLIDYLLSGNWPAE
ncbi:MAG: dockerin type I repeat-containing protein [Muribaculaceae bacterium]|nr:dockerin type I repeat-containing protein [Muribaculaceae bacterium]